MKITKNIYWSKRNFLIKKIVKHFRGNSTQVASHECGHIVLMRALDVVDDTVLMRKAVVTELAGNCIDLSLDPYGYRVIMQLISPNEGRYITNAKKHHK